MKQDEIIRMAREAGFMVVAEGEPEIGDWSELFYKLAFKAGVAHEREACAKVAAGYDATPWKHCQTSAHAADMVSASIAAAIRARGEK